MLNGPINWDMPQPLRGCQLCRHGATLAGERVCTFQAAVQPAMHKPVDLVRQPQGGCGPEARHLDFAGLLR